MHWPKVLKGLQVVARSVTVMPLFPRAFSSAGPTLGLRERTEPGELGLLVASDEPWPPPAEALFPCAPELPMLPAAPGVPAGRPFPCPYADEPRKNSVARARNGTNRRFIVSSSLVRRTAEESSQVETDSKIHRVEREGDGTCVADGQIDNVEGAGLKTDRETVVARDVGRASGFRRGLEYAMTG